MICTNIVENPITNDVGAYHTQRVWYKPISLWNWTARTVQSRVLCILVTYPARLAQVHITFLHEEEEEEEKEEWAEEEDDE